MAKKSNEKKISRTKNPPTEEQKKQLNKKPINDIREVINALDAWRRESLTSHIRI